MQLIINGGLRIVDISGDLLGDLYRQGREIAFFMTSHPEGHIPNSPNVWGTIPYKGYISVSYTHLRAHET